MVRELFKDKNESSGFGTALDIEMPKVDGFEVLEHMRTDMRLRDIPVIMISSVEGTDAVIQVHRAGCR